MDSQGSSFQWVSDLEDAYDVIRLRPFLSGGREGPSTPHFNKGLAFPPGDPEGRTTLREILTKILKVIWSQILILQKVHKG